MEIFKAHNLSFSYPGKKEKKTLDNVSFTINQGEYVVLCGRSGSGKTTLLRHFKSVMEPHGKRSGEIVFEGKLLEKVSEREQSERIGYVMQNPDDQIVTDKVWHELAFGLESLGCDQKSMRARVAEMACYFGIQEWFHKNVSELSGGQKQLLNLASIMVMRPKVLILDEPTSQLDPIAASEFLGTIRRINLELGTTIIISEHRLEEVLPCADRVFVMEEGKVIVDDSPENVGKQLADMKSPMFSAMPTPIRVFYGVKTVGQCPITVRDGRSWLENEMAKLYQEKNMTKFDLFIEDKCKLDEEIEEPVLELKEVWFRYEKNGEDVLKSTTIQIPKGCISVIMGGNGAGKSTMLKTISGICMPYRGKVRVFGKNIKKYKACELYNHCISLLPQDPRNLFVKKSVYEELKEMTQDEAEVQRIAEICHLEALYDNHPYDLSGGEMQRVALGKVLLTYPKILLLDEPTKGMDSFYKEEFADILKSLKEDGITIVMVSHDVEFCARNADRVSMFFDGQILTTNTPREFFGGNSFYTTAANRMSRDVLDGAITVEDIVNLYKKAKGE